jgi:hypothetical protein
LGKYKQVRAALALQLIRQRPDQQIFTILKQHGRAAVVLPDNVKSEVRTMKEELDCSVCWRSFRFDLGVST